VGCDLASGETGDEAPSELGDAEVEKLRIDCLYANPASDKAVILSGMSKKLQKPDNSGSDRHTPLSRKFWRNILAWKTHHLIW
jgi:hypothetical protein